MNKNFLSIEKILTFIWREFIYGGHLQSLGAVSIVFISAFLCGLKVTWDCLFATYLLFYPLYLYNRFKEIHRDYLTNPQRTLHFKKYLKWMPKILWIAIFSLIVILLYFSNIYAFVFGLLLLIFGLLYTVVFKDLTRKFFLFKNFYVSLFFAALIPFFFLYYSYNFFDFKFTLLFFGLFVFIKSFLMQVFFDVKDIESDKRENLLTLPVILGRENAFKFLYLFNLLVVIPFIIIGVIFKIAPYIFLVFLFSIPFNFLCYRLAREQKYSGYILESGEFILWLLLIFLTRFIYEWGITNL